MIDQRERPRDDDRLCLKPVDGSKILCVRDRWHEGKCERPARRRDA